MYNDEHNLYHYTYRKDGSEAEAHSAPQPGPVQDHNSGPQQPVQEMKPVKKNRIGLKVTALALCCALLGGAVGGGIVWGVGRSGDETSVNVSGRTVSQVALKTVDGKTAMSDAEVYAANINSVVSINVTGTNSNNFFGQPVQTASSGSGFILTTDGYIVTNYHVVEDAQTVKVTLYNGDEYDAQYVGGDEDYDIAVIKIEASGLQAVTLGDSEKLNVGDRVLAIGNPLGDLTFSMSGGMVSSVNRTINVDGTPFNMIQTDTSINPGNSGGPLLNSYGEVVGIVSAKYSSYGSSGESVEGLGFAIPINDVISMIQDIMTNGYVSNKAYLGATIGTLTSGMAQQYRYDISQGAFVYSVEDGSPAAAAGLQLGDVITAIDGTEITSLEDLTAAKKGYAAGDTSTLTVYRQGETITLELTWGAVSADQQSAVQGQTEQDQNTQNGGGYTNPYDLFEYFFG